tara:strand:- start:332 stop:616 length:285 start_codon:yes stop_codon:yes gene_type:complete
MRKFKIKVGDYIKIIAGSNKGLEGKVINIIKKNQKVVVEGLNLVKKHVKPNSKNTQGGIEEKEAPIHISNISLVNEKSSERRVKKVNKSSVSKK